MFSSAPKPGDKVIVKAPASPHNNKRGVYGGIEPRRKLHIVKHGDGTTSYHGDHVLVREDYKHELVKRVLSLTKKHA